MARARVVLAVIVMSAEGGDLDDFLAETDVNDPETAADDARIAKQGVNLLRGGIGGHVEVLGMVSQQQVAHSPARPGRPGKSWLRRRDMTFRALSLMFLREMQ